MQVAVAVFCIGVVWFYARFLYALLRERPRRHVTPIRRRNESQVNFAEKNTKTGPRRAA
jgi:hypothetical protein